MAKTATKPALAPKASILDRLRAAPADKLPVKPTTEIEESDRLLRQLRDDLARTAQEVAKLEQSRREVPAELAKNYVNLRHRVAAQERANALTRQRVDQAYFDKLAPRAGRHCGWQKVLRPLGTR